jgi:hypothetical protein
MKAMFIAFFSVKGITIVEYVDPVKSWTISIRLNICWNCNRGVELLDSALFQCHSAQCSTGFAVSGQKTYAPYSQDLTPCNFLSLKRAYFQSTKNFQRKWQSCWKVFQKIIFGNASIFFNCRKNILNTKEGLGNAHPAFCGMAGTHAALCRCQRKLLWRK